MSNHSNPRLLVVDDDVRVIAAYRGILEGNHLDRSASGAWSNTELEDELFGGLSTMERREFDWRLQFVTQGEDAVAAVRAAALDQDPFAAVFLDIRMPPGIDGYETAKQIRAIDPNVHVVFVSAYSDYTEDDLAKAAGPMHRTSFLPKPVWPDQFKAAALGHCREAQLLALLQASRQERALDQKTGT